MIKIKIRIIIFILLLNITIIADLIGKLIFEKYILTKIDIKNPKNYFDKKR